MFDMNGSSPARRVILTACAVIGLGVGLLEESHAAGQMPRSVWDGVYTETQAQRGKAVYVQRCGTCHGSGDQAPALYGSDFLSDFDGKTVAELLDRIRSTMPQDKPASLTPQEASDVTAYVLSFSFPVGQTEVNHDGASLSQIRFEAAKPKR
jgi:mono/diheme cytochrome c family protein